MELLESDLAQLDLPDPWWKWWNCATGWRVGGCFFLRFEMFLPLKTKVNGDKDAGCVFWFPRIKAFTQTKCGPISGCKFSTQKKASPFSHPQVGHFVTALDNDEMCFCCASSFSSRQERYLWVMGHKPLIAAKICPLV